MNKLFRNITSINSFHYLDLNLGHNLRYKSNIIINSNF